MDVSRFVRIGEDLHTTVKICKDLQGLPGLVRICIDLQRFAKIWTDLLGSVRLRICKVVPEYAKICEDLSTFTRIRKDLHGLQQ